MQFYLNEHIPSAVAEGLRRREVDVLTVPEAEMVGASDEEQLAFAAKEGRVIVTFDADYLVLDARGIFHAGIVFSQAGRRTIGELIERLLLITGAMEPKEMVNHVEFI